MAEEEEGEKSSSEEEEEPNRSKILGVRGNEEVEGSKSVVSSSSRWSSMAENGGLMEEKWWKCRREKVELGKREKVWLAVRGQL